MNTPRYNRLLLIDDEPGIRRLMALDLSAEGYAVATAEDGAQGLKLFAQDRPDIVITDLKMPGMDGIEVLRRVKAQSPGTEVIVITGHGDLDLAIQSLQLDASDFITKPIREEALAVALKRAGERLRLRAELDAYTRELEQRVAEATAKVLLNERLAAVGQTVSALVHSLKNMLAGLRGGAYLVRSGLEHERSEVTGQGLEMVERNLARVKGLVGDLLTLAKPREPELAETDLCQLGRGILGDLGPEAQRHDVELEWCTAAAALNALVEERAVADAWLNLVGNAVDAAGQVTGGRVRAGAEVNGEEVCLWVSDNGPAWSPRRKRASSADSTAARARPAPAWA
ncbi:MAG: hybrid sensor histidine kinase/response regulator [Pseudomonadota bacterium]